jgi:hypothetical protein
MNIFCIGVGHKVSALEAGGTALPSVGIVQRTLREPKVRGNES